MLQWKQACNFSNWYTPMTLPPSTNVVAPISSIVIKVAPLGGYENMPFVSGGSDTETVWLALLKVVNILLPERLVTALAL